MRRHRFQFYGSLFSLCTFLLVLSASQSKRDVHYRLKLALDKEIGLRQSPITSLAMTSSGSRIFNDALMAVTDQFLDLRKTQEMKKESEKSLVDSQSQLFKSQLIQSNGVQIHPEGIIVTKPDGRMVVAKFQDPSAFPSSKGTPLVKETTGPFPKYPGQSQPQKLATSNKLASPVTLGAPTSSSLF